MPYRQLPSTIIGRINVLESTQQKLSSTPQTQWAVSTETQQQLSLLYPQFRQEIGERQEQFARQTAASASENQQETVLRRYVSHFIQVFNLAVERGTFSPTDRLFYGLDASQSELPKLTTQQELITWAKNLIEGEEKRLAKNEEGKSSAKAMSNPRINEVENELNKYLELSNAQSAEKQAFDAENKDVLAMLPEIDELIRDIYDEVEFYYRKETPANKRKLAREWGVVYVSRKGEDPEEGIIEID